MKLNEVFAPLREEAYQTVDNVESYRAVIEEYFNKGNFLYRGMKDSGNVVLGDAAHVERGSAFSLPYVNWYVDFIDPRWSAFPKRTKSFICTTEKLYANGYGKAYFVIPLEGQNMAVTPGTDFFVGFKTNGLVSVSKLNDVLSNAFYERKLDPKTPQELKSAIEKLDVDIAKSPYDFKQEFKGITDPYQLEVASDIADEEGIIKYLNKVVEPSKFELTNSIPKVHSAEIWMEGKVLFLHPQFAVEQGWTNK